MVRVNPSRANLWSESSRPVNTRFADGIGIALSVADRSRSANHAKFGLVWVDCLAISPKSPVVNNVLDGDRATLLALQRRSASLLKWGSVPALTSQKRSNDPPNKPARINGQFSF